MDYERDISSGDAKIANWKMAIEIVDSSINHSDFPGDFFDPS